MMKRTILVVGGIAAFLGIVACLMTVLDVAMHVSMGEASELPDFPGMGRKLNRMGLIVGVLALVQTAMLLVAAWPKKTGAK